MMFSFFNYSVTIIIMMVGLYITIVSTRLIKKLIGLTVFQVSVLLFYISISFIEGGAIPIIDKKHYLVYVNPLPHVLMLTAIVVGVATLAVGLALIISIKNSEEKSDI